MIRSWVGFLKQTHHFLLITPQQNLTLKTNQQKMSLRKSWGQSGSLKKKVSSFFPSQSQPITPFLVCLHLFICHCVYVCVVHAHTVSDLCDTGDHDCEQVCTSTPGSYKCGCREGFTLMDDGRSCTGKCVCEGVCLGLCSPTETLHPVCCLTPAACSNAALDVVFVIDGSKSIRPENFELVKKWINQIVDKMDVSESKTHVGLVQYSSLVKTVRVCSLAHKDKPPVSCFINEIPVLFLRRSFPWADTTTRRIWRMPWKRWTTWRRAPWQARLWATWRKRASASLKAPGPESKRSALSSPTDAARITSWTLLRRQRNWVSTRLNPRVKVN